MNSKSSRKHGISCLCRSRKKFPRKSEWVVLKPVTSTESRYHSDTDTTTDLINIAHSVSEHVWDSESDFSLNLSPRSPKKQADSVILSLKSPRKQSESASMSRKSPRKSSKSASVTPCNSDNVSKKRSKMKDSPVSSSEELEKGHTIVSSLKETPRNRRKTSRTSGSDSDIFSDVKTSCVVVTSSESGFLPQTESACGDNPPLLPSSLCTINEEEPAASGSACRVGNRLSDPYKLSFNCDIPKGFNHKNFALDEDYIDETVVSSDHSELWLIKTPVDFSLTSLPKTIVLDGVQTYSEKKSFQIHSFQEDGTLSGELISVVPTDGKLKPGPAFKGQIHIMRSVSIPVLPPVESSSPDSKKIPVPPGLKIRFTPFGSDEPVKHPPKHHIADMTDFSPTRKAKKRKKKHSHSAESDLNQSAESTVDAPPKKKKKKDKKKKHKL